MLSLNRLQMVNDAMSTVMLSQIFPEDILIKAEVDDTIFDRNDDLCPSQSIKYEPLDRYDVIELQFDDPSSLDSLVDSPPPAAVPCSPRLSASLSASLSPCSPLSTTLVSGSISDPLSSESDSNSYHDCTESPRRVCLVCGDIASGYHYGVASCEACKAFFKRTVQGNVDYNCPAQRICEITKQRRKSCQACRYRKCLRVGMMKEGVRLDRVRGGRQKYRGHHADGACCARPVMYATDNLIPCIAVKRRCTEVLSINSKKDTLWAAQFNWKKSIAENKILQTLLNIESQCNHLRLEPDPDLPEDKLKLYVALSQLADRELVNMISWAKQFPGFGTLSLADQMNLLQHAWPELLAMNVIYRSMPYRGTINFADDFKLTEDEARQHKTPKELDELTRSLARKLTSMCMLKEEYVLLKALVLLNPDAPNVENSSAVQKLQDQAHDSLIDFVQGNYGDQKRVGHILMTLPLFRQQKLYARNFWFGVKQDGRVTMQKLVSEMLDSILTHPPI